MKYLLRVLLFNIFGLWLTAQIFPALVLAPGWQPLILAGTTLSLLMLIVKPILKILFIPINFLTFGLASWLINVILLYLLTVFVPEVYVQPWTFPGFSAAGFVVPSFHLSYQLALVAASLVVTFIVQLLHEVSEE